jgi:hypothetical protein
MGTCFTLERRVNQQYRFLRADAEPSHKTFRPMPCVPIAFRFRTAVSSFSFSVRHRPIPRQSVYLIPIPLLDPWDRGERPRQ